MESRREAKWRMLAQKRNLINSEIPEDIPQKEEKGEEVSIPEELQPYLEMLQQCSFVSEKSDSSLSASWNSLLVWNLILELLNPKFPKSRRYETVQALKSVAYLDSFFPRMFSLMREYSNEYHMLENKPSLKFVENMCEYISQLEIPALNSQSSLSAFSSHLFLLTVARLPALVRVKVQDQEKALRIFVEKFHKRYTSKILIARELESLNEHVRTHSEDFEEFTVRGNKAISAVTLSYQKDEMTLTMEVRLNAGYPLTSVEVVCNKKMGITESVWRKWKMNITSLLMHQDGSVLEAILIWKTNIEKHFEGVEMCLICYSVFHPSNYSLPKMQCTTCNNK